MMMMLSMMMMIGTRYCIAYICVVSPRWSPQSPPPMLPCVHHSDLLVALLLLLELVEDVADAGILHMYQTVGRALDQMALLDDQANTAVGAVVVVVILLVDEGPAIIELGFHLVGKSHSFLLRLDVPRRCHCVGLPRNLHLCLLDIGIVCVWMCRVQGLVQLIVCNAMQIKIP